MYTNDYIDFPGLIDYAMRDVVRKALMVASERGLPGEHHFFISFKTDFPGVKISDHLRSRHPHEMTIVLQHQYWDLKIDEEKFSVTLSFNNVPEQLTVPFSAMSAFADPSVKFGLQFHAFAEEDLMDELGDDEADLLDKLEESASKKPKKSAEEKKPAIGKKKTAPATTGGGDVVVTLDAFRKKSKKPTDTTKK